VAEKLPFDIRLANAIGEYEVIFGEHPPTFGYKDEELYNLLLNSIESKIEMQGIDKRIKDVLDIPDDENIYT
tara:strand:+ start:156 stop:371 length:216 start_codon:yes stop_codon:yes gene_type:complete